MSKPPWHYQHPISTVECEHCRDQAVKNASALQDQRARLLVYVEQLGVGHPAYQKHLREILEMGEQIEGGMNAALYYSPARGTA